MFTAFLATVTAATAVACVWATPMLAGALTIATENLLAYLVILPVKWTIEGLHRYVHRS